MNDVVIVSGSRTAVGAFGGSLKNTSVVALGASVMRETLRKVGLRPIASAAMRELAPAKLREQGPIELETRYASWDNQAAEIAIDEVIMGCIKSKHKGQQALFEALVTLAKNKRRK